MEKQLFLIRLTYLKDLTEIDKLMKPHVAFLKKYYALNKFIVSGRQIPRKGGIILCFAKDNQEVKRMMKEDPFIIHDAASFEILAFSASMYSESFKTVLNSHNSLET